MPFFFGRTTFIGSGAADELEGCPDSWYDDVDGPLIELFGARLFVECENELGRWATVPSGISPSRSTTKASE